MLIDLLFPVSREAEVEAGLFPSAHDGALHRLKLPCDTEMRLRTF